MDLSHNAIKEVKGLHLLPQLESVKLGTLNIAKICFKANKN